MSFVRSCPCRLSDGMCVAIKHGLVIVSDLGTMQLRVYSLANGYLVRTIGGEGAGEGQFDFNMGRLCVSPDGDSVLVAERHNNRVQQLRIVDGAFIRFIGERVLDKPDFVDCNNDVIVVSGSARRIHVLSWATGHVMAQFGRPGRHPGEFMYASSVRLLKGQKPALVVMDNGNYRLCVFTVSGQFLAAVDILELGLQAPGDVENAMDGFFVSDWNRHNLVKLSRAGSYFEVYSKRGNLTRASKKAKLSQNGRKIEFYGNQGSGDGEFLQPNVLAALPDGGLVVQEFNGARFQVFHDRTFRMSWIAACCL